MKRSILMLQVWVMFVKAAVQTILLSGSNIWVVTGEMLRVLERFHHRVSMHIVGKIDWYAVDREL